MMRYLLIILSLLLLLVSPVRAEEIGKVIAARGDTYAVSPEGEQRKLKRRSVILGGDTLFTGADARLQIRFADGTLVALRPESEYRIDSYQFNEAEDDENFSTLLKGGFRTITGVISKKDPEAYQVETPVATIGVRGTNYETALTDKGLDIAAWQGGVKVATNAGELQIGAGQDYNFATVGSPNARPQGLLKPPSSMAGPLLESDTAAGPETESSEAESESDGEATATTEETESTGDEAPDPATDSAKDDQAGAETTDAVQQDGSDGSMAEGLDDGALDSALTGGSTDTAIKDDGLITDSGFDTGLTTGLVTEDPTVTTVVPPDSVDDFVDTLGGSDQRLDPKEWDKLYTDGYGGFMVFGGPNSNHIVGGRALAPTGTSDPVFTESHLEPFDPEFKTAGVDFVYRRGMAPLNAAGVVTVGVENVYWGIWNGTTTPADKLIDPLDPNQVEPIDTLVYWAVARPIDPLRTDVAVFNFVDTFHGGGSLGILTPGDVTQFSMQINFATGAITNGVFDLNKSPENWNVLFDGSIQGPFVRLNIQPTSQINSIYPIIGDIGGFMTGKGGKALVGGFDLQQDGNPSNHIEGIFILRE